MFAMRTAARVRPIGKTKITVLTAALMATASVFATTGPASAATCNATSQASYDTCVATAATGDTIVVTVAVSHNVAVANPGVTLQVNSGGSIADGGASFGVGTTALVINGTGSVTTSGVDTFASLAGTGTLNTPSLSAVVFGNATNTSFSGTWVAPDLNTALVKQGTGTLTIDGMTAANGDFLETQGTILQSSGSTNIKSLAVGTGTGNTATTNVTGGTLTFTGTGLVGFPCASQCPALRIGDFGGTGIFNQSAGVVNIGAAGVAGSMNIGNQGGTGTYNMSGGTLNLGVFGDVNSAGLYAVGRSTTDTRNSAGVFNITGGLVAVNAGELINGDRDAPGPLATTSSTINLSGGTLRVRNGANLWLSGFNNAGAVDSRFNLSGTGVLEIGDGRLQDNYGGGGGAYEFNLNGGTIRVIDSALVTSVNAILLGASATTGTQIDTNGIGATWNGILSGTGWIVKTGAGTLNLNGANTYTGGTGFNGGTVFVDAFSDLGAASAGLSFNGGTLQTGANFVLFGRTGTMNMAGNGTIDTQGFFDQFGGNLSGGGTLTKIGTGFLFLTGSAATHTGPVNINVGSLGTDGPNAIGDVSPVTVAAGANFQISGGGPTTETIGSLAGAGSTLIAFGSTLVTGANGQSTTYTGTITQGGGIGSLTKVGAGTFTVNNNLSYTGLTTVNGGNLRLNGTMADSLLVNALGTFSGNATVNGNVTNNGHIAPGNSPGTTVIVGNYVAGVGAMFDMEVQFANAALPVNGTTHDFISIGGSATGTTLINVIPFLPSVPAAATSGNGVELVRVAGAVASGSQFQLAAPVVQGAYEYILTYRPNYSGALDGWFLTSRAGENLYGEAAMFTTGQAVVDACFRGEDALAFDGNGHEGRGWARVKTGSVETGADTGLDSDLNYTCGSGGVDVRVADSVRLGVSAGYASTDTNVVTPTGIGDMNGDAMGAQVYASMHHGNFFANLSAGYVAMDFQFDGAVSDTREGDVEGVIGGLQLGANWPVWDAWHLGAVGEVNYDGLDCDNQCLVAGTIADTADWSARGTLRLDGELYDGQFLPFVALSFSDRFGDLTVTNGSAGLTVDAASSVLGAKLGATVMIDNGWALFVNGGISEGLDNDVSGWDGAGGLKVVW